MHLAAALPSLVEVWWPSDCANPFHEFQVATPSELMVSVQHMLAHQVSSGARRYLQRWAARPNRQEHGLAPNLEFRLQNQMATTAFVLDAFPSIESAIRNAVRVSPIRGVGGCICRPSTVKLARDHRDWSYLRSEGRGYRGAGKAHDGRNSSGALADGIGVQPCPRLESATSHAARNAVKQLLSAPQHSHDTTTDRHVVSTTTNFITVVMPAHAWAVSFSRQRACLSWMRVGDHDVIVGDVQPCFWRAPTGVCMDACACVW